MISSIGGGQAAGPPVGTLAQAGGDLGKDEFLQLLVTQLRHQDPLNPMQAEDLAVQLAQFSSVEQLMNLNEQIGVQIAYSEVLAQGLSTQAALGVLGQSVFAATDEIAIGPDGASPLEIAVAEPGGRATVRIFDAAGKEVGSRELGQLSAGRHSVELGSAAAGLEPGVYNYSIEVTHGEDRVDARGYVRLEIDGIRYSSDGPLLTAGEIVIPLAAVREIHSSR